MTIPSPTKQQRIGAMFDRIAYRYDFLNHFLSFGIDRIWRKKAIRLVSNISPCTMVLDVATGTADLAVEALKLGPVHVKGIDISKKMLDIGRRKITDMGLGDKIELLEASSEEIPFKDNGFDLSMSAFGVRNFSDLEQGLSEMFRVLRNGGMVLIIEFSKPTLFPFKQLYLFYFRYLLPIIGRIISKEKEAYKYLPESVMHFPDNEDFVGILNSVGFCDVVRKRVTFGVASIYTGVKPL